MHRSIDKSKNGIDNFRMLKFPSHMGLFNMLDLFEETYMHLVLP